jgi:hypothetical protein
MHFCCRRHPLRECQFCLPWCRHCSDRRDLILLVLIMGSVVISSNSKAQRNSDGIVFGWTFARSRNNNIVGHIHNYRRQESQLWDVKQPYQLFLSR